MNKRLLSILTILSVIVVLLLCFHYNTIIGLPNNAIKESKEEQLISFIERQTIRNIQEPSTIVELNNHKGTVPDNCLIYFVNSGCSFCISELFTIISVFENLHLNERIIYAANDTITLSYYMNQYGYYDNLIIALSKTDCDSITFLNGHIYKIRNSRTVDMIDIKDLFNFN